MASLLERARARGTPLIKGTTATFIWEGERPPELIGDMTGWSPLDTEQHGRQFQPAGDNVWAYDLEAERDAYLEYALLVDGQRRLDPLNRRLVPNGFGDTNNYFHMPAAPRSPLFRRRPGIASGRITRRIFRTGRLHPERRRVWLYGPPVDRPVPLLVVFDGADYVERAKLPALLDNLLAAGRIAPLAAVFIDNAAERRVNEYTTPEGLQSVADFVTHEVLPWAAERGVNLEPPGNYGVLGSSAGGLASLWFGMNFSDTYKRVHAQAGGYGIPHLSASGQLDEQVRTGERRPIRIYLDCGTYDFLYQGNQRMLAVLREKGYPVEYAEYHAGHNYPAWREALAPGLAWLFPPNG